MACIAARTNVSFSNIFLLALQEVTLPACPSASEAKSTSPYFVKIKLTILSAKEIYSHIFFINSSNVCPPQTAGALFDFMQIILK